MKPSERIGPKNENWSAFLKQMNDPQFQAILGHDPSTTINRAMARELGEQSGNALREKVNARREELTEFRAFTLGKWFHEKMGEHFPEGLRERTAKSGPKEANDLGWLWGIENKPMFASVAEGLPPKLYPSSKIFLAFQPFKKRFIFFGERINKGQPNVVAQQLFHWCEEE